jgi:secreted trypsin-like serine protease
MRCTVAAVACLLSLCASADAIVGDAQPANWMIIRPALIVFSSRGGCSGALLGQDLVLTAGHCVTSATNLKIAGPGVGWTDVNEAVPHPQFGAGARSTADLALLKLHQPLPARLVPASLGGRPVVAGERVIIAGYGLTDEGWSFGTARMTSLTVNRLYNNLLELTDRAIGESSKLGGCKGDSGGPAFATRGGAPFLIGIIKGGFCGMATFVTPVAPYRDWITDTAQQLGSQLGP